MASACEPAADQLWQPSAALSPRVRALREEYFSFRGRDFKNEVLAFGTGAPDDILFSPHQWGVAPEVFDFARSFQDILAASATRVPLPDGFWGLSIAERRAVFFAEVIAKHLPVRILAGELIVGSYFNTALSRTLTPYEAGLWKKLEKKYYRRNLLLNATGIGNTGAIPGHLIPDYPTVIREGFAGLVERFQKISAGAGPDHRKFLAALVTACEAVPRFTARYAELAEREAASAEPDRREELLAIAARCRRVPWLPAENFAEALQSLWFTHMLVMAAESYPGPGLSPGWIDQYLYPYYRADLDAGRLSRDSARELLQCWFIKHNYAYDYMGRVGTNQGINSGFGQLITVGGRGPQGDDRSNDLTFLILDVIEDLNLLEPKPNVRLHQKTPEPLLGRVTEMVARAQGSPFLLNFDETSMAALEWAGLPRDRLWEYAPVGCLENTLQGCDRSGTVDVNLNLAKPIELVFGRGRDLRLKLRLGPRTADPASMSSFGAFRDAYFAQLGACLDRILDAAVRADEIRAAFEPVPYLSALVRGCEDSGRDVSAGGPQYNFITVEGVAFATAVDSLAAVKKLVFEEGRVSLQDLARAIRRNFKKDDALRKLLLNRGPKFGNDESEADDLAAELNRFLSGLVITRVSPRTGRRFRMGYLSWNYWILYADLTSATPDGRLRGTYLSNGICPVTGVDRKGPVAVARSVHHADLRVVPNGASHTISFQPALARTERGRQNLAAFLRAYGKEGGSALQINVLDPATLRRAQQNPGDYGNLLVRVTGYNAYFTTLGREIQDEIIARESFRLGGGS